MSDVKAKSWCCSLTPTPPLWALDWEQKFAALDWVRPMIGCKQDEVHHAEGDVATHVRLVCEQLVAMDDWRSLDAPDRATVFLAAALHDVAKPECTVVDENGRISSAGHGKRGAQLVREILYYGDGFAEVPAPLALREAVSAMVRYSSLPLWLWDKDDPTRSVIRASQSVRLDWLAMLSLADARGRSCQDLADLLARIKLFCEYADELKCLSNAYQFQSNHSRFVYFHKKVTAPSKLDPSRLVFDDTRFEVVLMSGLPGAGKDSWIARNGEALPVVSLDAIRVRIGADSSGNQSRVVKIAREEARQLMRDQKSFIWNATNLTRFMRDPLIRFFHEYGARIRIVYVEPPSFGELFKRNAKRENPVATNVIERLARKLEVPDLTEAHELTWVTE